MDLIQIDDEFYYRNMRNGDNEQNSELLMQIENYEQKIKELEKEINNLNENNSDLKQTIEVQNIESIEKDNGIKNMSQITEELQNKVNFYFQQNYDEKIKDIHKDTKKMEEKYKKMINSFEEKLIEKERICN